MTLTAAQVDSELTLSSTYTGAGHPVATLTLTATNGASSAALTTTASQTLSVTDPPSQASANGSLDLAKILFDSNTALGYWERSAGTGAGLTVSDGVHTAAFELLIQHAAAAFNNLSDNGGGGAIAPYLEPAWSLAAHSSLTVRSLTHA